MKAFEKGKIGGIEVKNRIFRSATWEGTADKGKVSDSLVKMYKNLAKGDVGLIITGYVVFQKLTIISLPQSRSQKTVPFLN